MAIEVTCGQCHGRLLVETPGGVVACPHCGVHLAVPLPEGEPTTEPPAEPSLEGDTAIENPPTPGEITPEHDPGDIQLNLGTIDSLLNATGREESADPFHVTNVLDEPDDEEIEAGWHSAPNLYVGQSEASPAETANSSDGVPQMFSTPVIDRDTPPPGSVRSQAMSMFPAFGESPQTSDPVWNFTPGAGTNTGAEATSTPDAMFLSSSQQFTLDDPTNEPTLVTEQPLFSLEQPAGLEATVTLPTNAAAAPTITLPGEKLEGLELSSSQQFSLGAATPAQATQTGTVGETSAPVAMTAAVAAYAEEAAAARQRFLVLLLIVIGSYSSAITIVVVYLLSFARTHQLESLPDLKPPMKKGEIQATFYSPKNDLPVGHVLKLGQSQRYGNVRVTPVKVTRGPVTFAHYSGKTELERSPTEPLLKLWLKFENVSRDQTFSPLDELLTFKRVTERLGEKVYANSFLVAAENRKKLKSVFHNYDMPPHSEFLMVGQKLGNELPPEESWQTFVPSEEEAASLKGDVVWRVQIRKGYHPASLRGVTTLIDVTFNSEDISNES